MAGNIIKFLIEMRDNASKPLDNLGKTAAQTGTHFTELNSKVQLLVTGSKAAAFAIESIARPFIELGSAGIEAGAQMEGFETRLTVLMGSAGAAKDRLDELFQIGSTTPFELPGLIEAEVNLRALGVNAEKTLPMVMDFAGAMGVDLASAAVEVGRAMQFGAGAVETISGRALRAQVELSTGADALKMSTEEFREAMVQTLTDPDGIFAGGTDKLAATFNGMLSNLSDSFFKFRKEVGDADLFVTAKATLKVVLDLLDKNKAAVSDLASTFGKGLADAIIFVIDLMFKIPVLFLKMQQGAQIFRQIWLTIKIAINEASIKISEFFESLGADRSQEIAKATKFISQQNLELAKTADIVDDLKDKQLTLTLEGADTIEKIERLSKQFAQAPTDDAARITEQPQQKRPDEEEQKQRAKIEEKTRKDIAAFIAQINETGAKAQKAALKITGQWQESDELGEKLTTAQQKLAAFKAEADRLGISSGMTESAISSMNKEIEALSAKRKEAFEKEIEAANESLVASLPLIRRSFARIGEAGKKVGAMFNEGLMPGIEKGLKGIGETLASGISTAASTLSSGQAALQAAGTMVAGPVGGELVGALTSLGEKGADTIKAALKEAIEFLIVALVDVLPDLIGVVPVMIIEKLPEILEAVVVGIGKMLFSLFVTLPQKMAEALAEVLKTPLQDLGKAMGISKKDERGGPSGNISRDLLSLFSLIGQAGKKHAGTAHIDRTGMFLLQQGEQVVPNSGTTTQNMARRMGLGGGVNVNISTNVVDQNAIRGLGRLMEREFGSMGRSVSPIFNSPTGVTG